MLAVFTSEKIGGIRSGVLWCTVYTLDPTYLSQRALVCSSHQYLQQSSQFRTSDWPSYIEVLC